MTGAVLLGLLDAADAVVAEFVEHGPYLFAAVTDHDQDALRVERQRLVHDPRDHRPTAERSEHLRPPRLHASALAGGQDDYGVGPGHREGDD